MPTKYWKIPVTDAVHAQLYVRTEVTPETKLSKDAARCLEYSQGKPLEYYHESEFFRP